MWDPVPAASSNSHGATTCYLLCQCVNWKVMCVCLSLQCFFIYRLNFEYAKRWTIRGSMEGSKGAKKTVTRAVRNHLDERASVRFLTA